MNKHSSRSLTVESPENPLTPLTRRRSFGIYDSRFDELQWGSSSTDLPRLCAVRRVRFFAGVRFVVWRLICRYRAFWCREADEIVHCSSVIGDLGEEEAQLSGGSGLVPSMSNGGASREANGCTYIEHRVTRMDTLAGIAIKYGVEVWCLILFAWISEWMLQLFSIESLH